MGEGRTNNQTRRGTLSIIETSCLLNCQLRAIRQAIPVELGRGRTCERGREGEKLVARQPSTHRQRPISAPPRGSMPPSGGQALLENQHEARKNTFPTKLCDTIGSSMLPHAIRDPKKAEKETEEKCSSHDTRCLSNGSNQTRERCRELLPDEGGLGDKPRK